MKVKVNQEWWDPKLQRTIVVKMIDRQGVIFSINGNNGFVLRPMTEPEFLKRGFVLRGNG